MPGPRRVALLAEGVDRNSSSMVSACSAMVALLAEGVDRNRSGYIVFRGILGSPSSQRAWIEIVSWWSPFVLARVALLAEGVDRNMLGSPFFGPALPVALLAEGVDRNSRRPSGLMYASVALLAEGVDRNCLRPTLAIPARVALLAEGVDRNSCVGDLTAGKNRRPPRGGRG